MARRWQCKAKVSEGAQSVEEGGGRQWEIRVKEVVVKKVCQRLVKDLSREGPDPGTPKASGWQESQPEKDYKAQAEANDKVWEQ